MQRRMPIVLWLVAGLLPAAGAPARAGAQDPADLCVGAARLAAGETGVPLDVLLALTLTETGRAVGRGPLRPWAWALNQGGASHWFDTAEDALAHLEQALAEGTTNIDVGCFQLNYRWHAAAFASVEQMIDPEANALYAARHIAGLYGRSGDWVAAAGAYHSATPELAERYLARFTPIYSALGGAEGGPTPPAGPVAAAWGAADALPERVNMFPLLQSGATGTAASLVPLGGAATPLIGGS